VRGLVTPQRWADLQRAFWVALAPGGALFVVMQVTGHIDHDLVGVDSHAYWQAVQDPASWYTLPPGWRDAYLYSPAFAQVLWPIGQLPWPAFQSVWLVAQLTALTWLLAPLGWRRGVLLAPFFVTELLLGNVYLFFAVALAAAMSRAPGAIALPILTKVAPGVVGLWWVARREWRPVARASLVTMLVTGLSVLASPDAWSRWISFLADTAGERGGGSAVRLALAAVVIVIAARRHWPWLLAPALVLACPILGGGYGPLAALAAIPRLLALRPEPSSKAGPSHPHLTTASVSASASP
jgi:hypothetical protein